MKKMINIAIRAVYYIFCIRNRNWDSPDLMQYWFFFSFFFLPFFFLNNPISSSICKLPIRSGFHNCAFKNTNKVSITIISIYTKKKFIIVGPDLPLMLQQPISFKTWGWGFSLFITFSSVIISCLSLEVALALYEKENYNYMTKQHLHYYYHYCCCCFVITISSIPTRGFSFTLLYRKESYCKKQKLSFISLSKHTKTVCTSYHPIKTWQGNVKCLTFEGFDCHSVVVQSGFINFAEVTTS